MPYTALPIFPEANVDTLATSLVKSPFADRDADALDEVTLVPVILLEFPNPKPLNSYGLHFKSICVQHLAVHSMLISQPQQQEQVGALPTARMQ